jgi:energy-coupling factor transport system permease protein
MTLHPATRILMWLAFALFLPWLDISAMLAVTLLLLPVLLTSCRSPFISHLRRTRWLLLSIFLIYALATPGENWVEALGAFSPTGEGVHAGAMQAWRLGLLLAGLSLLLSATPGKQLLGGMYWLLQPWARFGVASDRIAARVWLTLYYAEQAMALKPSAWRDKLGQALYADNIHDHPVTFEVAPLVRQDWLALALTLLALGGLAL